MTSDLEDMRLAYGCFNERLFDGRLPPLRGRPRVELAVEDLDGCVAQCGKRDYGFRICFDRGHFGQDLAGDLSTLVHEMAHADLWRETRGGHDAPWRAWMLALGFDTDDQGRETPIEGGKFARCRDAWMKGRRDRQQTEPRTSGSVRPAGSDETATRGSSSPAASGAAAFLLTLIVCGLAAVIALASASDGGRGRRDYGRYDGGYGYGDGYDEDRW
jgi:hypothetical protein